MRHSSILFIAACAALVGAAPLGVSERSQVVKRAESDESYFVYIPTPDFPTEKRSEEAAKRAESDESYFVYVPVPDLPTEKRSEEPVLVAA